MARLTKNRLRGKYGKADGTFERDLIDSVALEQTRSVLTPIHETLDQDDARRLYESSTFCGWSCFIDKPSEPFRTVKLRLFAHSGDLPDIINLELRDDSDDLGPVNSPVIVATTARWQDRDKDGYLVFDLGEEYTTAASTKLRLQYWPDDADRKRIGVWGTTTAENDTVYYRNYNTGDLTAWVASAADVEIWAEFGRYEEGDLTQAIKDVLQPAPKLNLPNTLYAVQGEVMQLFHRGIVIDPDPYKYIIRAKDLNATLGEGNLYDELETFPRYVELEPQSTSTTAKLEYYVYDTSENLLSEKSVAVNVVNPSSGPASNTKILCVGDSLTAGGTYVTELQRRLVQTGGSPAGKNYSNLTFIGSQGSSPANHEGQSGKTWSWFATDAASPFVNSGSLDINNYITSTLSDTTVDQVYFLLTWNGWQDALRDHYSDWEDEIGHARNILEAFQADFSGVKCTLIGLQMPDPTGGLAASYGDAHGPYGKYWQMVQSVYGLNWALERLAEELHDFVDYIDFSSQFDTEYNNPGASKAVNTRSATTETIGSDGIHPDTEGYYQLADAVYRHVMAKWCV